MSKKNSLSNNCKLIDELSSQHKRHITFQSVHAFHISNISFLSYSKCVEDKDYFWCSTKVDSAGLHQVGQGKYGFCEPRCQPKIVGK